MRTEMPSFPLNRPERERLSGRLLSCGPSCLDSTRGTVAPARDEGEPPRHGFAREGCASPTPHQEGETAVVEAASRRPRAGTVTSHYVAGLFRTSGSERTARRASAGQTLVEFALVLPILLALTVGLIDLARGVYFYNTLSNSAREGARFGTLLIDPANGSWVDPGNLRCRTDPVTGACLTDHRGQPYADLSATYSNSSSPTVAALKDTNTIVGHVMRQSVMLDPAQTKITITVQYGPEAHMKQPLKVEVEHPYRPIVTAILGDFTVPVKASAMMRVQ